MNARLSVRKLADSLWVFLNILLSTPTRMARAYKLDMLLEPGRIGTRPM